MVSNSPVEIKYLPGKQMYPSFGVCFKITKTIWINDDIPRAAKAFVLAHEIYHLTDNATNWIAREIKANIIAFLQHPWGGIIMVVMSFAPYRLAFYWKRFKEEK